MIIQHNIMAMNAYRNYKANTSALSSNLEKLSSGYKINRAGDDAAGLAISEKMRAQITGLEAAQKNVKDGISLVKTAEGAMQEIQDMLNRMDYLATQSANGTYQDEVDRENLNKEMEALKTEINRIADSANFNGIKLLDGSLAKQEVAADEVATDFRDAAAAINHIADGVASTNDAVKGKFSLDLSEVSVTNNGKVADIDTSGATLTAAITQGTTDTTTPANSTKATITYDFANTTITDPEASGQTVKITLAGKEVEIDVTTGGDMGGGDIASAVVAALGNDPITIDGVDFTVSVDSTSKVKFEAVDAGLTTIGALADATVTAGASSDADGRIVQVDFGGTELGHATVDTGETISGKELAEQIMNSLTEDDDGNKQAIIDGVTFNVTNADGVLTFEMAEDPTSAFTADLSTTLKVYEPDGTEVAAAAGTNNGLNDLGAVTVQGEGIGVHMLQDAQAAGERVQAQGDLDLTTLFANGLSDGTALKIGNDTYIFAVGSDSKFKDAANVVDLTDYSSDDPDILKAAARRLSGVAVGNKMFDVSTDNTNATVRLTERKNSGIDYAVNNLQGSTKENLNDVADSTKAWANLVQVGKGNPDAKAASTSGGLNLQIGDTSDEFNQMKVYVGDMHVSAMGTFDESGSLTTSINDIDILTSDHAQAAVDVIKNAINYVSGIRGDLGAYQNRLEHTANNLSVMAENITDAESTIRDTDVAEEMMSYVKNNILVQSAQAMLAQANQVPQGVLQLLG